LAIVVAVDPHPFAFGAAPAQAAAARITPATIATLPLAPTTVPGLSAVPAAAAIAIPAVDVPSAPETTAPATPVPDPVALPATSLPAGLPSASLPSPPPAIVARVTAPWLFVYPSEGATRPTNVLASVTEFGTPRVLLTTALRGDWIEVLLPTRPNGSEGWVRARDVSLAPVSDSVDVNLATRTLTWTRGGQAVLQTTVGVGAPSTPTPTGTFFVTDILPEDANGSYGAWLVALNAHSDAFTTFEGGDPRIALHGTNDPSSIGRAVSSGCVHVAAGPIAALAAGLVPGTPVIVH
jgi:hypothetical protein